MFDNEEVDDDYFTPMAKTSLASIFKKPVAVEKTENETLKYTPPVPKVAHNNEEPPKRPYETVYSCVFDAYLWLDNVYTNKGKLGCAVVKHNITEGAQSFPSILLYDSKKTTISIAYATKELEVTLKGNNVISYYDRYEKYWCLNGSEDDVKKIINVLKTCHVNVKVFNKEDNALSQECKTEDFNIPNITKKNLESDTDSSINRKTKATILSRMANMGQSVLPPRTNSNEQSSDSSYTNECDTQVIAVRHKPVKKLPEKKYLDLHKRTEAQKKAIVSTAQLESATLRDIDNQILPLQSSVSSVSTSGHDLNYFFTEQRIANSELRINMTRVTDKVDDILNKVNNMEKDKNEESTINTDIFQKLLREYENKIKTYEELFQKINKGNSTDFKQDISTDMAGKNEAIEQSNIIYELRKTIQQKDDKTSNLIDEINVLKKATQTSEIENQLRTKISDYDKALLKSNQMMIEKDELLKAHDDQTELKIKSIMNNTFRAIEINFDDNITYSGEAIKSIVATVIKKVTIESLNNPK